MPGLEESLPIRSHAEDGQAFDIVKTYQELLHSDKNMTMPIAAIESLVSLLASYSSLSTVSETLALLESSIATLKASTRNAISLSAGTDLFQRYLITTLQRGFSTLSSGDGVSDFKAIRQHLVSNGQIFATRAKEARNDVARIAQQFISEGTTILTNGGSRVVGAVLQAAAVTQKHDTGAPRFRVIWVTSQTSPGEREREGENTIASLRKLGVPVATIPESAVAYSMGVVSMVFVGAEGVVENGGVISRLGTYQVGLLAKAAKKPMYIVAESHKFVRMYPLGQYDLAIDQKILDFSTETSTSTTDQDLMGTNSEDLESTLSPGEWSVRTPYVPSRDEYFTADPHAAKKMTPSTSTEAGVGAVDFTPPELITAIVTETGVLTPSAVSEELIKIWD